MSDYTAEDAKRDVKEIKRINEILGSTPQLMRIVLWLAERELERTKIQPDYSILSCRTCFRPLHPLTGHCPQHGMIEKEFRVDLRFDETPNS